MQLPSVITVHDYRIIIHWQNVSTIHQLTHQVPLHKNRHLMS